MTKITINSHDFLGKLTIIKNHLFVVLEEKGLSRKAKKLLEGAYQANEELITMIKKTKPVKAILDRENKKA